ncbi:uncharacterized protein LOC113230571 isoform X4 [Hyposmocoma kahamanoa]|uniref:uncharacterized protein LOC113230571 isoform X4 n=1 Tax=Hyposmocoma kahamanoa TaxID=1477025 RepID=UPI000E6D6D72|nr:uncharacterized protein LOC113230571 isoform X4 [Hyposmocoma kahamanoa]
MFRRGSKAPIVRVVLTARAWRRVPMKLLKWGRKMPSTKQYNLVPNDEYDTRIPLHPDEAFSYGITFQAKYIGTMDVPRPTSRVEIVAAMRRVRYEFKAKGVKKRKVTVDVSTDGVRVTTRIKKNGKFRLFQKTSTSKLFGRSKNTVAEGIEIMHHPIYRIFYVSHDSSDLKIFSYIARDGATNVFKCNVFKSNRKSQAMRIVRTVGQAFEVCHKMQVNMPEQPVPSTSSAIDEPVPTERTSDVAASKEGASECGASESGAVSASKIAVEEGAVGGEEPSRPKHLDLLPPPPRKDGGKKSPLRTTPAPNINLPELPECITKLELSNIEGDTSTPLSAQHQSNKVTQNVENNNIRLSPYGTSPNNPGSPVNGPKKAPTFDGMTNEEIQNYLIEKFQRFDFGSDIKEPSPSAFSSNQHFFQNSRAFPNIPPLTNHYSNSDLASLLDNQPYEENSLLGDFGVMTQPMVVGHSPNSLTNSKDTSKDSSPTSSEEGVPFIMPLSHNGTLTATGEDGRMRLIVPVSPSPSSSDVVNIKIEAPPESSGATLKVPDADRPNPAGPITRSTSEKVPNRSEMMTALRAQWTRHTTK